jgi:ribosomal protein S15P/S13E
MSKVYEYLKDRSGEDGPQHPSEVSTVKNKTLQSMCEEAIKTMEHVADTTKDIESFKQLTIGYNKIKALIK